MAEIVGASFTSLTVTLNAEFAVNAGNGDPESVTITVICAGPPTSFAAGVTVTVQFGNVPPKTTFAVGIMVVFDDEAVIDELQFNVESVSVIVNAKAPVVPSSAILWAAIAEITGASLTASTVNANVDWAVSTPGLPVPESVTVNVIFTGPPFWLAAGVTVTVQFGTAPPTTIFAIGIIVVFDDETVIEVLQFNVESASLIVNAKAAVAVSSLVDKSATVEIVGASLTAFTVTVN